MTADCWDHIDPPPFRLHRQHRRPALRRKAALHYFTVAYIGLFCPINDGSSAFTHLKTVGYSSLFHRQMPVGFCFRLRFTGRWQLIPQRLIYSDSVFSSIASRIVSCSSRVRTMCVPGFRPYFFAPGRSLPLVDTLSIFCLRDSGVRRLIPLFLFPFCLSS